MDQIVFTLQQEPLYGVKEWFIRTTGRPLEQGEHVIVNKADGTFSEVEVGELIAADSNRSCYTFHDIKRQPIPTGLRYTY